MSSLFASVTVVAVNASNHCPASTLHCRSLLYVHRSLTLRDQNLMARVLTIVVPHRSSDASRRGCIAGARRER